MIEGFIGRPGAGKTYTMTRRLLKIAERRPVFSNYAIDHPNVTVFEPQDLMRLPSGVIALDEAHLYFPARGSLRLPMSWLTMLSQTRKMGWDLMYTSQHEARVDRALRDITNVMWWCKAWGFSGNHPWFFAARGYEPEYFRKTKKAMVRSMSFFDSRVANAYDTYAFIQEADHLRDADVYRQGVSDVQGTDDRLSVRAAVQHEPRSRGRQRSASHEPRSDRPGDDALSGAGVLAWQEVLSGVSDGDRNGDS